jgi:hypothetical protein
VAQRLHRVVAEVFHMQARSLAALIALALANLTFACSGSAPDAGKTHDEVGAGESTPAPSTPSPPATEPAPADDELDSADDDGADDDDDDEDLDLDLDEGVDAKAPDGGAEKASGG